jgi:hypothetical protein
VPQVTTRDLLHESFDTGRLGSILHEPPEISKALTKPGQAPSRVTGICFVLRTGAGASPGFVRAAQRRSLFIGTSSTESRTTPQQKRLRVKQGRLSTWCTRCAQSQIYDACNGQWRQPHSSLLPANPYYPSLTKTLADDCIKIHAARPPPIYCHREACALHVSYGAALPRSATSKVADTTHRQDTPVSPFVVVTRAAPPVPHNESLPCKEHRPAASPLPQY